MARAELVGGPIDGTQFEVPEPPPPHWRRPASSQAPTLLDPARPDDESAVQTTNQVVEHYVRDARCGGDGTWRYRYHGTRGNR